MAPCPNTTQVQARKHERPSTPSFSLLFLEVRNSPQRGDGRNLHARAHPPSFSSQPSSQPPVVTSFGAPRRHGALPTARRLPTLLVRRGARPLFSYFRRSPSSRRAWPASSSNLSSLILLSAPGSPSRLQR